MEHMRRVAFETVLRASGFSALAIFCMMFGLSYDLLLAFRTGAFLTTLMAAILIFKSIEARTKDYRKTELWICLDKKLRPPEAYAQRVTSTVLREIYLTVAFWCSAIAIAMWLAVLLISVTGAR